MSQEFHCAHNVCSICRESIASLRAELTQAKAEIERLKLPGKIHETLKRYNPDE